MANSYARVLFFAVEAGRYNGRGLVVLGCEWPGRGLSLFARRDGDWRGVTAGVWYSEVRGYGVVR